ncbi:MAG: type II/IV secretion system protein [Silicimonas sp.]|nr:type II/IV secretion system protein [Silicimonas sp.]
MTSQPPISDARPSAALSAELAALAEDLGLPVISLENQSIDAELFKVLSVETASRLTAFPMALQDGALHVAIPDPLDLITERRLRRAVSVPLRLSVAPRTEIEAALKRAESSGRMLAAVTSEFRPQIVREDKHGHEEVVDLDTIQDQSGVVLLANSILMAGLQKQVSDIHIEVYADRVDVKYRIDGILYPASEPIDVAHHAELISRFKVMASLDIAEKRKPQDGRFRLRIEGRDVDFRVSVLPTQYGEDIVIRVLDKAGTQKLGGGVSLDALGFAGDDIVWLRKTVREPHGLVLITGPTGSGKTTTLYGALSELVDGREKIITVEDPVEYELDGIVQIAVNEKKGLSFAAGLRSILRHDPDRIMVGEIRDLETAEIAVQAALTGHLVLASVHANNAIDVLSRFTHWGIDLHDFVTSLNAVAAQRLLRKNCAACSVKAPAEPVELLAAGLDPVADIDTPWTHGTGCPVCRDTGYLGRTAVLERIDVTPTVSDLMIRRANAAEIVREAQSEGMIALHDQAEALARQGVTSLAEIARVIQVQ